MELNVLQVVLLLGLLSGVVTEKKHRCYRSHELDEAARQTLQRRYPRPAEPAASGAGSSACPLELYAHLERGDQSRRSLSPWRYETVALPDHYPSSYVRAVCLCSGCIQFKSGGEAFESYDFNSDVVSQSRVFLRRERCDDDDSESYRLAAVSIDVAVGCTCVRPRS